MAIRVPKLAHASGPKSAKPRRSTTNKPLHHKRVSRKNISTLASQHTGASSRKHAAVTSPSNLSSTLNKSIVSPSQPLARHLATTASLSSLSSPLHLHNGKKQLLQSQTAMPSRHFHQVVNDDTPRLADGSIAPQPNEITWKHDIDRTDCGVYIDRGLPPTFNKILIANRGEIACRVIRTCRQLGIETVAVYSEADANSMFVQMADEAYNIGPAASSQSYLRGDYIIELAKKVGAQAIHPGYGFLSENADFAKQCFAHGIEFIGPPVDAIVAMGSKSASKNIMESHGVRCVPGYHGENQDPAYLKQQAGIVGYPIMLKAVLGGGGKGMRIVWNDSEFDEALEGCKREALNSFKDERVLLERYIQNPRHIEFQIFADKQGNVVHLFERDCSVQRRHQKVFEEAPAPGMTPELRLKMGTAATDAARAVGYAGAGTVEFIVDADTDEFFFMEMNTRLQVEHCVSEMIVHRDLVQWQLHVAAGYRLPTDQEHIKATGHALELRVYAENPRNNFLPTTGHLAYMKAPPAGHDIRVETGVRSGDDVSVHYDPMISKLVVWAPDRVQCLKRMLRAIGDYKIAGLPTNLEFAKAVLRNSEFQQGGVTTKFIPTHHKTLLPPLVSPDEHAVASTVLNLLLQEQDASIVEAKSRPIGVGPWASTSSFRLNEKRPVRHISLEANVSNENGEIVSKPINVDVTTVQGVTGLSHQQQYEIKFAESGNVKKIDGVLDQQGNVRGFVDQTSTQGSIFIDNKSHQVHYFAQDGDHHTFQFPVKNFTSSVAAGSGTVSPMAGKIVKVNIKPGDHVKAGQPLVIMEAMKMEHILRASADGIVKDIMFTVGDFCEGGKRVVTFEEAQ